MEQTSIILDTLMTPPFWQTTTKIYKKFLKAESEAKGLNMNVSKTKTMVISRTEGKEAKIIADGKVLEQVHHFKYLGQTVNENGSSSFVLLHFQIMLVDPVLKKFITVVDGLISTFQLRFWAVQYKMICVLRISIASRACR